jgi:hypothetical protein
VTPPDWTLLCAATLEAISVISFVAAFAAVFGGER